MFVKISEQPSLYNDLEKKSVREILEDINTEDQKVALAVQRAIPQIEKLVTQIVPRMKQGGRIFYMGAGTSHRYCCIRYHPLRDWCHARGTRTRHTDRLYHQQPGLSNGSRGRCSHRNDCRA